MQIHIYQLGDDSHLYRDATEKVLILRKAAQDKVYLYVLRYYILYVKTVFQWRPYRGGSHLPADISTKIQWICMSMWRRLSLMMKNITFF